MSTAGSTSTHVAERLLGAPAAQPESDPLHKALGLAITATVGTVAAGTFVLAPLMDASWRVGASPGFWLGFGALLAFSAAWWLHRRGSHAHAARLYVGALLGATTGALLISGPQTAPVAQVTFILVPVVVTALFLSGRATAVVSAIAVLQVGLLPLVSTYVNAADLAFALVGLSLIGILLYLNRRVHDARMRDVAAEGRRGSVAHANLAAVVEATDDAIVSLDATGRIVVANHAAHVLFKNAFAIDDAKAGLALAPAVQASAPWLSTAITSALAGDVVRAEGASGPDTLVEARVRPLLQEDAPTGILVVLRDRTADREAERVRAKAADQEHRIRRLIETSRFQNVIINAASHHLRTPLTTLRLQVGMLKNATTTDPDSIEKTLRLMDKSITRLTGVFDDVCDAAVLSANPPSGERETIDLRAALHAGFPPKNDARVTVRAGGQQLFVRANTTAIDQMLDAAGRVARRADPDGSGATLYLDDRPHGAEMRLEWNSDAVPRLEADARADLALAIYRAVARSLGGDVHYHEANGARARVVCELPAAASPLATAIAARALAHERAVARARPDAARPGAGSNPVHRRTPVGVAARSLSEAKE